MQPDDVVEQWLRSLDEPTRERVRVAHMYVAEQVPEHLRRLLADESAAAALAKVALQASGKDELQGMVEVLRRPDSAAVLDGLASMPNSNLCRAVLKLCGSPEMSNPVGAERVCALVANPDTRLFAVTLSNLAFFLEKDVGVGDPVSGPRLATSRFFELLSQPGPDGDALVAAAEGVWAPKQGQGFAQILQIDNYREILRALTDQRIDFGARPRSEVIAAFGPQRAWQEPAAAGLNSIGGAYEPVRYQLFAKFAAMSPPDVRNMILGLGRIPDPTTRHDVAFALAVAAEADNIGESTSWHPEVPGLKHASLQTRLVRLFVNTLKVPGQELEEALTNGAPPERVAALAGTVLDRARQFSDDGYFWHSILEKRFPVPAASSDADDPLPLALTEGPTSRRSSITPASTTSRHVSHLHPAGSQYDRSPKPGPTMT